MALGGTTFGNDLLRFALTIDIVDANTYEKVKRMVGRYMGRELDTGYFGLMEGQVVEGEPGLATTWATDDRKGSMRLRGDDGKYTKQVAVAFDRQVPLWVVSARGEELQGDGVVYRDLWSRLDHDELPKYTSPLAGEAMRTSIMVPIVHSGVSRGLMYLESPVYVEALEVARQELSTVARALAQLMMLRVLNNTQLDSTRTAVDQLTRGVSDRAVRHLTKPQLFLASPKNADGDVMAIVRDVLADYGTKVDVVDWATIEESGAITKQIADKIVRSRFGVCYFSEPTTVRPADFAYRDNPNVIFEAGMLHALINAPDAPPSGWIPVRENDSPAPPFDFASERIEYVPRGDDASLDEAKLRARIKRRLDALLDLE